MNCPKCGGYMAYTKQGWYCRKCNSYPEKELQEERAAAMQLIPPIHDIDSPINDDIFTCPQCHSEIESSEKFCHSCGFPVSEYILSVTKDRSLMAQRDMQFKMQMASLQAQKEQISLQQQQLQIQKLQYDSMIKCPRCGSTSISGQKKGYGPVKAGLGALALGAVAGPVGAVVGLGAGNIGRKKVICTCMKCGKKFKA